MNPRLILAGFACLALAGPLRAQQPADRSPFRFAVLGHIRGGHDGQLNPKLAELVERLRTARPEFLVLTGDAIFGDYDSTPSRPAELEAEWNRVDSALGSLGVPIYRVPGNHDLSDGPSREVYARRYGLPPAMVQVRGTRLILLRTPFLPGEHDTLPGRRIGGVDLDTAQLAFLRQQLADTGYAHTVVIMHHLLWWEDAGGRWWREVHPLLAAAHVDAVFSGDYGPMKFSTMEKDGVRYYQGAMEPQTPIDRLGNIIGSRLLSSQFDTWFLVDVAGDSLTVGVRTVAEVSAGDFTPARWRAIESAPPLPLSVRVRLAWRDRRNLILLVLAFGAACFVGGVVSGVWGRRRAARA